MCTVTFIQLNEGFILTANRDEVITRKTALKPEYFKVHKNKTLLFTKDKEKGGTWIATDGKDFSICLFNGAYISHEYNPPYRKSRGNIPIDFFSFSGIVEFTTRYDFSNIEPFSLVIVQHSPLKAYLLIWDGDNTNLQLLKNIPQLWASVTLYKPDIKNRKEIAFLNALNEKKNSLEDIVFLHKNTTINDKQNDFIMKRNDGHQTVSISSIENKNGKARFYYEDLVKNQSELIKFKS